jgi:lipocalin
MDFYQLPDMTVTLKEQSSVVLERSVALTIFFVFLITHIMEFNPDFFGGTWKEYERHVEKGESMLYPRTAKDVTTTYDVIAKDPLEIHLVNSYVGTSWFGYSKTFSIEGHGMGEGTNLEVVFEVCCSLIFIDGKYEVLDFEEKDGTYTHLFVGGDKDKYRWILVRDLDQVDQAVVERFKKKFPRGEFFKSG